MRKRTVAQAFHPEEEEEESRTEEESEEEDDDEEDDSTESEDADTISESSYESTDSHYGFFYPEGHI